MKTTFHVEVRLSTYAEASTIQEELKKAYPHKEVFLVEKQEDDDDNDTCKGDPNHRDNFDY